MRLKDLEEDQDAARFDRTIAMQKNFGGSIPPEVVQLARQYYAQAKPSDGVSPIDAISAAQQIIDQRKAEKERDREATAKQAKHTFDKQTQQPQPARQPTQTPVPSGRDREDALGRKLRHDRYYRQPGKVKRAAAAIKRDFGTGFQWADRFTKTNLKK